MALMAALGKLRRSERRAVHFLKDDHGSQLCRVRFLRTADLDAQRASGPSVCYGLNGRFCNSGKEPS